MDLLTGKTKDETQLIIEPLGLVFANWQLNRIVGNERKCQEILENFRLTSLVHNSLHEIIGKSDQRRDIKLVNGQELPLIGERRVIESANKTTSAIVGLPEELKSFVDQKDFHSEAIIALDHGLLPLAVAVSVSVKSDAKFGYIGTLLFEPKVRPADFKAENVRVLSVLPSRFIAYYYQKFGDFSDLFVDAASFMYDAPPKIEKNIDQAAVIGAANLRERYQLLALIGSKNSYRFVSRNIQDEQLLRS